MDQKGFTLIEMMVTLAIGAILVMMAIPNYQIWNANEKLKAGISELKGDLQIARIVALKTGVPVVVTFEQSTSTNALYFLYQDTDSNSTYDNGEPLLNHDGGLTGPSNAVIKAANSREFKPGIALDNPQTIVFRGSGRTDGTTQLVLKNDHGKTRTLTVTPVGDIL